MAFTKLISGLALFTLFSVISAQSVEEVERSACYTTCYPKLHVAKKNCPAYYGTVVSCYYQEEECKYVHHKKVCTPVYLKGYKCDCIKPSPTSSPTPTPSPVCKPTYYSGDKTDKFTTYFDISKYYGKVPYHYTTYGKVAVIIRYGTKIVYYAVHQKGKTTRKGTFNLGYGASGTIKVSISGQEHASWWKFYIDCPKHY